MIRFVKIAAVFCIIAGISQNLYAYSKIYLLPEVEVNGEVLRMSDIAVIEGNDSALLYEIEIPGIVEEKRIIDKREIHEIISKMGFSGFAIYGNGVSVNSSKIIEDLFKSEKDLVIKKGDSVKIAVIKNGVIIEMQGESLSPGSIGESVKVKLNRNKVLIGTVAGKGRIVLELK